MEVSKALKPNYFGIYHMAAFREDYEAKNPENKNVNPVGEKHDQACAAKSHGFSGTVCIPRVLFTPSSNIMINRSEVVSIVGSELASDYESYMSMFESGGSQFLGSGGLPSTDEMIASQKRCERQDDVADIPRPLTYGYNNMVRQKYTCIWSRGAQSWTEALSGLMWVAVHGMDSICVATRIKDLEHELTLRMAMLEEKPEILLRIFRNGLIAQVEDFVDLSSIPSRKLHQIIKKPFGVVSVISDTKIARTVGGHKAISAKYDEQNAINFLQKELESGAEFAFDKTVQTAICALDHLFRHEFKANEIQVFVWKKDGGDQAKALSRIREDHDIEEHLASINTPDSCV